MKKWLQVKFLLSQRHEAGSRLQIFPLCYWVSNEYNGCYTNICSLLHWTCSGLWIPEMFWRGLKDHFFLSVCQKVLLLVKDALKKHNTLEVKSACVCVCACLKMWKRSRRGQEGSWRSLGKYSFIFFLSLFALLWVNVRLCWELAGTAYYKNLNLKHLAPSMPTCIKRQNIENKLQSDMYAVL